MNKKQILHIALLACSYSSLMSSTLFLGDLTEPDIDNQGFSFNLLKKLGKTPAHEFIYMVSAQDLPDEAKKYAVSVTSSSAKACLGIAAEKATINGNKDQENPLHGARISNINMAGTFPVFLKHGVNSTLYYLDSSPTSSRFNLLTNDEIKDANQETGTFITFAEAGNQDSITGNDYFIIAAVKPDGGSFGEDHGGIAVFKKTSTGLVQQKAITDDDNVKSFPIQGSSVTLKITNDVNLVDNKVNLCWDSKLQRLFVGVQATSANAVNDGCKSTAVGYLKTTGNNTNLILYSITRDENITGENKIIGAQGAGTSAYVYKQTIMHCSTGTSYLITVGTSDDPGNDDNMQKMCSALPLVDESVNPAKAATWQTSTTHATLAAKDSTPTAYYKYNKNNLEVFVGRGFQTPAQEHDQLFDITDPEVLVGRGPATDLNAGIIRDLAVYEDTVFVLLGGNELRPGVFYSQALFDENGAICNWTVWQRVTYTQNDALNDFAYMPNQGSIFHLEEGAAGNTKKVALSKWSTGEKDDLLGGTLEDETVGLTNLLNSEFPQEKGGIFGMFDFPPSFATTFFTQAPDTSMMIATGYKKVGLILTYSSQNVGDAPVKGDFKNHTLRYEEGTITLEPVEPFNNVAIFISGGAIDDLEAITSATLLTDIVNDKRYIIVGGTRGLAVLRNTTSHNGFDDILAQGFQGLTADIGDELAFEVIGDFKNVKKLWTTVIGNDQYLFVLTTHGLHRIIASELGQATPEIDTLATIDTIPADTLALTAHDFFTDVIVSNKFCLLGTNKGLLRNGNDTNICTEANATDCDWQLVNLPAPYTYVDQLLPLLTSPLNYQFATQSSGQIYVLAHSNTLHTSVIHRYKIKDIDAAEIDNNTCTLVAQETVKNSEVPFMSLNSLRNACDVTGAFTVTAAQPTATENGRMLNIPPKNMFFSGIQEPYPATEIKLSLKENKNVIRGFVRHSALGSWIAYGDFGIRVCE